MITFILGGAFILGFSILFHELGHYLLGRMVGIRVAVFSIGYGKGVWKKQIGETTWQITAIPLGGYVKFYGDDLSNTDPQPGDFFAAPPLKRMIPVIGGPLFNLILGFLLFILLNSLYGPMKPVVAIMEESAHETPAYRDGLRNGDIIESVNETPVKDFYKVKEVVAMSGGDPVIFKVLRNGAEKSLKVNPMVDSGGLAYVGLRPPGLRQLEVSYPSGELLAYRLQSFLGGADRTPPGLRALSHLHDGDVILSVAGEKPQSVIQLQQILGRHHGETVEVKVKRESIPFLTSFITHEETVSVPTRGEYRVSLVNIVDKYYNQVIPDQNFFSNIPEHQRALSYIKLNRLPAGSFERIYSNFSSAQDVELELQSHKYSARISVEKIGTIGFHPRNHFTPEYAESRGSVVAAIAQAGKDTLDTILVYPRFFSLLFSGRMSFVENARGPVGMFAIAGEVISSGLHDYLHLFAAISIALMVLNLLPIPVVDGGHLVFFLYEAIVGKPVSLAVMETVFRIGLSILLLLGAWIMYRDILFILTL